MKMKIQLFNKISKVGLDRFPSSYTVAETVDTPDGILVRSANMHEAVIPESVLAIARAGAGVNNIPIDQMTERGVVVFNTPGANANGVKELTLTALFLSARDIYGGIKWSETLTENVAKTVEKGKSAFAGIELRGKTLGVIGLGAIGGMVANAATSQAIGMKVVGFDPYLSIESAWNLSSSVKRAQSYDEIFESCDFITLHIPATSETKGMINQDAIAKMKDGVRLVNLSRAELVEDAALIEALESGKIARYVTDFPTDSTVRVKNLVTIPHLGASTEESEDNCAIYAVEEIVDYLENGNIRNSVNFPKVSMPRTTKLRLAAVHKNVPSVLSKISSAVAEEGINIAHMSSASKGEIAYTVLDIDGDLIPDTLVSKVKAIDGYIFLRVIGN